MVTRSITIISLLAVSAALAAIATVILARHQVPSAPQMNTEQRDTHEKFFGTAKEPAPIPKGQEMRPRW